jgi:membrane protein YdbS with pleckstrin-like domain
LWPKRAAGNGRKALRQGEQAPVHGYLEPGEQVQVEARPHGVALARPLARALGFAGAGGVLVVAGSAVSWGVGAVGALLVAVGALVALVDVWRWDRTHVVLTTEKLFVVHGLAQRRAAAVRLERAGPVEVEEDAIGRLLGYGTVSAGGLEIPYVPREFCRLLA